MGGNVIGIDATPSNIAVASNHALQDPTLEKLTYLCMSYSAFPHFSHYSLGMPAEELAKEKRHYFDIITCLEVWFAGYEFG